ncbi:hypothetical protein LCGC14_0963380 [marine sediment metagenome]|uniref:Uncharacterized protein n=1 Tax=marine sediment metagenome TaxID=412755 RepID=A0A0F9NIA9_9ZZZZ
MTFDHIREFVSRCKLKAELKGCRSCGGISPSGLFLKHVPYKKFLVEFKGRTIYPLAEPCLSALVESGHPISKLKEAMRSRGWYCRDCVDKKKLEDVPSSPTSGE